MKSRNRLIGALVASACASASFAGFTVTASFPVTAGGFDRYDITAVNTGGDTGTQVKGLEYFYSGSAAAFQVDDTSDPSGGDPDGIPDTVNLLSASRTRIRVSTTGANNVFVGVSPANDFAQPNPYAAGLTSFQGAIANTGATQASGAGFQIARIFLPADTTGVFSGNIGGDIGSKVPFSVNLIKFFIDPTFTIDSVTPDPVNVAFGSIVSNGAPFTATVQVGGVPAGWNVGLLVGGATGLPMPAGVQIDSVTGGGTVSRSFVVSGRVDYSLNGMDVAIPIQPTGGFINERGQIRLHITPEPTLIGSISLALLGVRRRRRP